MNKFKKILTLVLTFAVLITAFAIVASASTEEGAKATVAKQSGRLYMDDFEKYENGAELGANKDGAGEFYVKTSENGNHWVDHYVAAGTGNANYYGGPYKGNHAYSFTEYVYCAIDFDIMKSQIDYATMGVNAIYYGNGKVYDDLGNLQETLADKQITSATVTVASFKSALATELHKWSHVTVIFHYNVINGTEYIGGYAYVNGELVYSNPTLHKITTTYSSDLYYFGTFRLNNSGGTNNTNHSGYDNLQINFYNNGYSLDEVGTAVYNGSYDLPFGTKVASIGDELYDNIDEAIAAAKSGDTIRLYSDVDSLSVNKTVILDLNKYDEDGKATGEFYKVNYNSERLVAFENDPNPGFVTFKELQNSSVEIYWDDCPGMEDDDIGKCICPEGFTEHSMSAFTPSAMLNTIPSYPGEIPTFPITKDGVSKKFVGWSYTQGGDVDEIVAINQDDLDRGYIAFYPVYEPLQYAYEVTFDGKVNHFLEEEVTNAFATAPDGATIKLLKDVEIDSNVAIAGSVTVDFNGYDVWAYSIYRGVYKAVADGSKYTAGDLISSTGTQMGGIFDLNGKTDKEVIFKSSKAGTEIYSLAVIEKTIMLDNGEVYSVSVANNNGYFLTVNSKCSGTDFYFYGNGISLYASTLLYSENHNNDNVTSLYVDGGTYYNVVSNYRHFIHWTVGGDVTIKNATFIGNGDGFFRDADPKHLIPKLNLVIDNCDIVNCDIRLDHPASKATVTNSRLSMARWTGSYGAIIGEGTYTTHDLTSSKGSLGEGLEQIAATKKVTYMVSSSIERDPETLKPIGASTPTELVVEYKFYAVDPVNGIANIIWKDHLGNVIATSKAIKNMQASAPSVEVPVGDGYRAVTNVSQWLDAEGNLSDLTIGTDNEYVFTAVLPDEADRKYVAYLDSAMANLVYYAHFAINIYVPKVDGITVVKMGNNTSFGTALIDGQEYYFAKIYVNTNGGLGENNMWVTYSDGTKEYTVNVKTSIMWYAEYIVNDPASSALEKEAIGCLVRYIEETYKAISTTTDADGNPTLTEAQQAKLDDFYADYTPADYVTEYPANELHEVNTAAIEGLIESIHFTVLANGKVGLAVTLTDEAYEAGYKIRFSGIMYGEGYKNGKVYYTDNQYLYRYIMTNRYDITVLNKDGSVLVREINGEEVTATTTYSLATYCKATDSDLAKSLYALGKAVIAVRESLY